MGADNAAVSRAMRALQTFFKGEPYLGCCPVGADISRIRALQATGVWQPDVATDEPPSGQCARTLRQLHTLCTYLQQEPAADDEDDLLDGLTEWLAHVCPVKASAAPADAEPADTAPADAEPADAEPADAEPADAEPADAEPADAEPADAEPADTEPADEEHTDILASLLNGIGWCLFGLFARLTPFALYLFGEPDVPVPVPVPTPVLEFVPVPAQLFGECGYPAMITRIYDLISNDDVEYEDAIREMLAAVRDQTVRIGEHDGKVAPHHSGSE